ncbi:MAG: serine hydrolase [Planctomycetales bacterium]|nr:serine hydrolase [Planctomycetales bacterium]
MLSRPSIAALLLSAILPASSAVAQVAGLERSADQTFSVAAVGVYPHAAEPIGSVREIYDGALSPKMAESTFRNIDRLFPTRTIPRSLTPMPLPPAASPLTNVSFQMGGKQYDLIDYLKVNRIAAILVLKDGRVKLELYRFGNTERTRWMSMSIAKSISSTLFGAAVKQGYIQSLSDNVTKYVPSLAGSAYEGVSIRDVLMMSSGVGWSEIYTDPKSDRRRLLEAQISQKAGAAMALMKSLPRVAEPGTVNNYNTGETQVAAEILRGAIDRPLATYLYERIWSKFGMEADANWWLESPDGIEIGGSGFSATLRDYGRFGLFMLNGGLAGGEAILPDDWIREATTPKILKGGAPLDYGYLWWPGTTPAARQDKAYMAIGIHGQTLYVNPAAKVVVVAWGARPQPMAENIIDDWPFCDAVAEALKSE